MTQLIHIQNWKTQPGKRIALGGLVLLLILGASIGVGWLSNLKGQVPSTPVVAANLSSTQIAELTKSLTQSGVEGDGVSAEVILATIEFFRLTNRSADAAALRADQYVVFVANESVHQGELPPSFGPILRVDGKSVYVATDSRVLADAGHHRTTALIFEDLPQSVLASSHTLELVMPQLKDGGRQILTWYTPIDYPEKVE